MPGVDDRYGLLRNATASSILGGPGATPHELRRAVAHGRPPEDLAALVEKIRSCAYTVTEQDLDVLRARYSEDQLFEIIVAAAFGAAQERLAAAQRVLDET